MHDIKTKLVLKICPSSWENASRDKRELSACKELGMRVVVMAKGEPTGTMETVEDFNVYRVSTRPWKGMPVGLNRLVSMFTWARYARRLHADIISGHDLVALAIAWVSTWFLPASRRPKLIYDAHEFELGRSVEGKRSALTQFFIRHGEKFLMQRCAFSIMVNDSIADEVQRIHQLPERAVVVRSIPGFWERDETEAAKARRELCEALGLPQDVFLVMYHGGVIRGRGIENMLRAIARIPGTAGVVLGNGQADYLQELHALCKELGIGERVLFHNAVPHAELFRYVAAANVAMVTVYAACRSYYFMLPNKFFESIQAETPVIVSDFPEVGRLTAHYGIGLRVDPEDVGAIAAGIIRMQEDQAFYAACKQNLKIAKQELCWEKEKQILKVAYAAIL